MPSTMSRKPARRPNRATFSDELRDAIERDGRSAYAISKAAEVDAGIVSRFLSGRRSMTTDTLDRLAAAMGLHLAAATRGRGRPRRPEASSSASAGDATPDRSQGDDAGPAPDEAGAADEPD